jgi:hypothetical protein
MDNQQFPSVEKYKRDLALFCSKTFPCNPARGKKGTCMNPKDNQKPKLPPEQEFLTREGAKLHYAEEAAGRGPSKRTLLALVICGLFGAAVSAVVFWLVNRH